MWREVADPNERVSPLMESRDQLERLSGTNGDAFARSAIAIRHAVSPIALPAPDAPDWILDGRTVSHENTEAG
jgi:hypothetical protein